MSNQKHPITNTFSSIAQAPIGIFDSGIGGLTIASALRQKLPNESILYVADNAHFPFGNKTPEEIAAYTRQAIQFLTDKSCKLIIIACHTASAVLRMGLLNDDRFSVPVLDVIEPTFQYLTEQYAHKTVGIIATERTIQSQIYQTEFNSPEKNVQLIPLACPLLATAIEQHLKNPTDEIFPLVASYLSTPALQSIDALLLGCTHYPLVKSIFSQWGQDRCPIIDPGDIMADQVTQMLTNKDWLSHATPAHHYVLTDTYPHFEKTLQKIFSFQKFSPNTFISEQIELA